MLRSNPTPSVRTPRLVVDEGKTPISSAPKARALFASLEDATDLITLRDRALFAVMLFGFVRVGAVVQMRVHDFEDEGENAWLVIHEKGGKERRIPLPSPRTGVPPRLPRGGAALLHGGSKAKPGIQGFARRGRARADLSAILARFDEPCGSRGNAPARPSQDVLYGTGT